MRRGLLITLASLVLGVSLSGASAPASASSALPSIAELSVSPESGPPTAPLRVRGRGFGGDEAVDLFFDGTPIGSSQTREGGRFSAVVRAPSTAMPGDHEVTATGETSGRSASDTFLVRTDWPQFSFDGQNRRNPFENVLNPGNVGDLTEDWSTRLGGVFGSPILMGGIVFVATFDSKLWALDAATGSVLWTRTFTAAIRLYPVAVGEVVLVGLDGGTIQAVDASSGNDVWSTSVQEVAAAKAIATGGGLVFVPTVDKLIALDPLDGRIVWTATLTPVLSGPAVAENFVYVGSNERTYALDIATGAVVWGSPAPNGMESVVVAEGKVFIGDFEVSALNAATGTLTWTSRTRDSIYTSPTVADGVVYAPMSDLGRLWALDLDTGAVLWSKYTSFFFPQSPAVANGVVYVGNDSGLLLALDATTGNTLWSLSFGEAFVSTPIVADGRVYAEAGGVLYAFGLPNG